MLSRCVSSRQLGGFKRHPGGFQKNVLKFDGSTLLEMIQSKKKKGFPKHHGNQGTFFPMKPGIRSLFCVLKKICGEGRLQACKGS